MKTLFKLYKRIGKIKPSTMFIINAIMLAFNILMYSNYKFPTILTTIYLNFSAAFIFALLMLFESDKIKSYIRKKYVERVERTLKKIDQKELEELAEEIMEKNMMGKDVSKETKKILNKLEGMM